MQRVWTYSIVCDEAQMLPWFIRHYSPWVEKMVFYVEPSTDGTEGILRACPKAEIRPWPHRGLDDEKFLETVNSCYKEARGNADWVAFVDPDELLYHPNMAALLEGADGDIFPATGYAMISPTEWPSLDDPRQLYEIVRTGVRQPNFDKRLLHRPELELQHTHGRHTYGNNWPKHGGRLCRDSGIRLLHCHHIGGVQATEDRNARNYSRCLNQKFGWNYDSSHNSDPNIVGSLAWVKDTISSGRLFDVFTGEKPSTRLNFGCGGNRLVGWDNYDFEVDISRPLTFGTNSVTHVFAEHVVEHIAPAQAWAFFEECYRVLKPGGIIRIAVPDLARAYCYMSAEYQRVSKAGGASDGSRRGALRAIVCSHGHQAVWSQDLLSVFLASVGFVNVEPCECGKSRHPELNDIEGHWRVVGRAVAEIETSVVEGTKPY